MRGLREALLLAGVLPLLAQDDVPVKQDETDRPPESAAEALHDDTLNALPELHIDLHEDLENEGQHDEEHTKERDSTSDPSPNGKTEGTQHSQPPSEEESYREEESSRGEESPSETENESDNEEAVAVEGVTLISTDQNESENTDESNNVEQQVAQGQTDESVGEKSSQTDSQTGSTEGLSEQETEETKQTEKDAQQIDQDEEEQIERVVVDYASKSAGALILEKSPSMKGTSNLLNADRDKYAIAPCEDKRFVVVGLSEDILVKQVRLANYERYSSSVKNFQIMASQDMHSWADLGTYTARPQHGEQTFDLAEPAWARYLKFRFLTHHGSEHYCTVSQIQVHGSTQLQGFQAQWRESESEIKDTEKPSEEEKSADSSGNEPPAMEGQSQPTEKVPTPNNASVPADSEQISTTQDSDNKGTSQDDVADQSHSGEDIQDEEIAASGMISEDDSKKQDPTPGDSDMATQKDSKENAKEEVLVVSEPKEKPACKPGNGKPAPSGKTKNGSSEHTSSDSCTNPNYCAQSCGNTSLPDELLGFQFFVDDGEKSVLSFASIGVSSHKPATQHRPASLDKLEASPISSPPSNAAAMNVDDKTKIERTLSEAVKEIQDKTADAVKELQEMIKSSIEGSQLGSAISRLSSLSDAAYSGSQEGNAQEVAHGAEGTESGSHSSGARTPDDNETLSTGSDRPLPEDSVHVPHEDQTEPPSATTADADENNSHDGNAALLSNAVDEALKDIVRRFPSAECLRNLDFQEFKAKVANSGVGASGGATGGPGKMEPIFKTLADEIKALQVNQSVHNQFTKALVSCYQTIIVEIEKELQSVRLSQESRLLRLEEYVQGIQEERERHIMRQSWALLKFVVVGCVFPAIKRVVNWFENRGRRLASIVLDQSEWVLPRLVGISEKFSEFSSSLCEKTIPLCEGQLVILLRDESGNNVQREISVDMSKLCAVAAGFILCLAFLLIYTLILPLARKTRSLRGQEKAKAVSPSTYLITKSGQAGDIYLPASVPVVVPLPRSEDRGLGLERDVAHDKIDDCVDGSEVQHDVLKAHESGVDSSLSSDNEEDRVSGDEIDPPQLAPDDAHMQDHEPSGSGENVELHHDASAASVEIPNDPETVPECSVPAD